MSRAARLHEVVSAVCPIVTVRVNEDNTANPSFVPAANATAQQITDGTTAMNAIDWSTSAQAAWEATSSRGSAKTHLDTGTLDNDKLLRALALVCLDEFNIVRTHAALGLAPRTFTQLKNAIKAKLDAGTAD